MNRRHLGQIFGTIALFASCPAITTFAIAAQPATEPPVVTGADALAAAGFAPLTGLRVGLITNQTGHVGAEHLADLLSRQANLRLSAIFAPEHGLRGLVEAGAAFDDRKDIKTGVPILSLYGATRKPTPKMLRDVDVLVFDIQDVGVRSYTYISTMGLAMQAAAQRRIPFVVLDRPNPLGGTYVSGFALEPTLRSFVGQYPIPIVHGMTIGEMARAVQGEQWLDGLSDLELKVIPMQGWRREMRWPDTQLAWVQTSPNVPSFEAALSYPGIGLVGETLMNEGRGTSRPFSQFGAPWLDARLATAHLNALALPGVRFEPISYTPRAIPNVAAEPRFEDQLLGGVRLVITDVATYQPLEVGVHVLVYLQRESRLKKVLLFNKLGMFNAIAGTARLHAALARGDAGSKIIASWRPEVERFKQKRARYLLY